MTDVNERETVWSRTKAAIEERGWGQGALVGSYGKVCLLGGLLVALNKVKVGGVFERGYSVKTGLVPDGQYLDGHVGGYHHDPELENAVVKLGEAIGPLPGTHTCTVKSCGAAHVTNVPITWNDTEGRTQEEVLDLLQGLHEKELAERGELA